MSQTRCLQSRKLGKSFTKGLMIKSLKELKKESEGELHNALKDSIGGTWVYKNCGFGFANYDTTPEEERQTQRRIKRGVLLEKQILEDFQEEYKARHGSHYKVLRSPFLYQSERNIFTGKKHHALIDGLLYNTKTKEYTILDAKNHDSNRYSDIRYNLQMQWYMHILGIKTAHVVHAVGSKLTWTTFNYDEKLVEIILKNLTSSDIEQNKKNIEAYLVKKNCEKREIFEKNTFEKTQLALKIYALQEEKKLLDQKQKDLEKEIETLKKHIEPGSSIAFTLSNGKMLCLENKEVTSTRASLENTVFKNLLEQKHLTQDYERIEKLKEEAKYYKKTIKWNFIDLLSERSVAV